MGITEYFISCDWGTSNFRLRVIKVSTLEIIQEIKTNQGVKKLFEAFKAQNSIEQFDFFSNYLWSQIQLLATEHRSHTIVASGMASSSIGLYELEYANVPFNCSGSNLKVKRLTLKNKVELLLVSGVKDEQGMMRGEEIQALGFEEHLHKSEESVLLLPGTHSKHLIYNEGIYKSLKSYMTGELFEILSQKSILANSIVKEGKDDVSEAPFLEGVKLGSQGHLTSSLFSIRANDLFGKTTKEDNYFFLSGLLLGDELAYLKKESRNIFLASPYPLSNLYKIALDYIIGSTKYIAFSTNIVEKSLLIGQTKILQYHDKQ